MTRVAFRILDGEVIALFPDEVADPNGNIQSGYEDMEVIL